MDRLLVITHHCLGESESESMFVCDTLSPGDILFKYLEIL